jgi:hypothetical protein
MNPDRKKILDRLAKILALADASAFSAEAETARRIAEQLMAEHDVSRQDIADSEFELREIPSYFQTDVQWDRIFKWSLGELNGCYMLLRCAPSAPGADRLVKAFIYVGRPIDIDAALYMTDALIRQRGRAFIDYKAAGGEDGKAKFFFGYAKGLKARVEDIRGRTESGMAAQGKRHLGPSALLERQKAWYVRNYGEPNNDLETFAGRGSGAGFDAGSGARFTRGNVAAPHARLTHR